MTGGLWDYEESDSPADVKWPQEVKAPRASPPSVEVEEDEEGNGRRSRRCHGRQTKKSKLNTVIKVDEADLLLLGDSDSDSDFKVISMAAGKDQEEDDLFGASASTMQPQSMDIPGGRAGSSMNEATREAMERSKALNLQLRAQLDDDNDDFLSSSPLKTNLGSLRMHSQNLRQTAVIQPLEKALPRTAEDEDDAALLREDAAASAGISGTAAASRDGSDGEMITIVFQCQKGGASIRTRKTDPFSKLQTSFLAVALSKGWFPKSASGGLPPGFKMLFDGEKVDLNETPEGLDLEDGEKIDVTWKG